MAEEENHDGEAESIRPEFPTGRVKRIMKLDKDINKVNSEALYLVTCATQQFLECLAERSAEITTEKKRKVVTVEYIRVAVKRHPPTSDFLLDSLPQLTTQPEERQPTGKAKAPARAAPTGKTVPTGMKRIDDFFNKQPASEGEEAAN